jgi:hypothetical protein
MRWLIIAVLMVWALDIYAAPSYDATVTWTDNSSNETGFRIYRGGNKIGEVGANVSTYTDTGLALNQEYCYQIGAYNTVDEKKGPQACATTGSAINVAPSAPTIIFIYKP